MSIDIDEKLIFDDDELALLSRDFDCNPEYSRVLRHRLFVYGTMRQGAVNHARLHQCTKTKFLGYVETKPYFDLDLSIWKKPSGDSVPIATIKSNAKIGNSSIAGELYEISGSLLKILDLCEGHPNVYMRIKLESEPNIWMYLYVSNKTIEMTADGITRNSEGSLEYKPCQSENNCSRCTMKISR